MLKKERLITITKLTNKKGIITVNEIVKRLAVSNMTVRRDLDELASDNHLIRIHGGAQSIHYIKEKELSRIEKQSIHVAEKSQIAHIVANKINNGETVFLGPGTTNELVVEFLDVDYIRLVTNSLPVFEAFKTHSNYELCLVGGTYRQHSGAFIGSLTNEFLTKLRMNKAFVSVNGVFNNNLTNASPEEGRTQSIALNNSHERYAVADHYKINFEDFYSFYQLNNVDGLITDSNISIQDIQHYQTFTDVITNKKYVKEI
ncbi:DeoR/GlpR family DNA-binding transcription regulator [Loigolactobacillus coryniformis]|uniref:DeoR/GlpR family DNA-binding transcription regulator n=1 Tax=Loigolactobacillus coryniformis TaxID=1610 RepID=UPI001C5FE624|nr:DeoR/GlpR family DNA-binding transcription regulator [Loigolactobacillus coryniformis]MBW4803700.1 DeoR/GlpR transcriptional regulator [Loigolactobacillus coryniformis subsp. torquens]MBW4806402.1 DeoR/GlpR transcriptional regulator [Loigolactobacillus coryniformis subsp. torquens]